jgi:hypothetical protein
MSSRGWRSLGVLSMVGAVLALAATVVYATVTYLGVGTGSGSTAVVSLSLGAPAQKLCSYTGLEPGDLVGSPAQSCTFSVKYSGSIAAHMALDVVIQTHAGSGRGKLRLYDPAAGAGLTLKITDSQVPKVTYSLPTTSSACPAGTPAGTVCYSEHDNLVSAHVFTSASAAVTFTISPHFPKSSGNAFQGATAGVKLVVHVVQAAANPLPATCNASTVGQPCPPSGIFTWG